jgi:hypothetical protein
VAFDIILFVTQTHSDLSLHIKGPRKINRLAVMGAILVSLLHFGHGGQKKWVRFGVFVLYSVVFDVLFDEVFATTEIKFSEKTLMRVLIGRCLQ